MLLTLFSIQLFFLSCFTWRMAPTTADDLYQLVKVAFFLTSEETLLIIPLHDTFHEVANQDICNAKQWDV